MSGWLVSRPLAWGLQRAAVGALAAALLWPAGTLIAGVEEERWHLLSSEHFTIVTNADPALAGRVGQNLERFRSAFSRLAPELELKSPVPTSLFVFRDTRSFAPFMTVSGETGVTILGQFVSRRDGNVITVDASAKQRDALPVVFHEYVHYLTRHNFPGAPLWFQEGLAEYYSTFRSDGEAVVIGLPVQRHVDWLRRAVDLRLEGVLEARRQEAPHLRAGSVGGFYAVSWALVHYLLSGDAERLGQVAEYLILLQDGAPSADALERALGLDTTRLERRLIEVAAAGDFPATTIRMAGPPAESSLRIRSLSPAEAHAHRGELLLQLDRFDEAEQHFRQALDAQFDQADALAGLATVRDHQSRFEEAEELYKEALKLGSTHARTFFRWGRHYLAWLEAAAEAGNGMTVELLAAAARGALLRAVELAPRFAEARALLGIAHLYGDADPARGAAFLEQALEALPDRSDLLYRLVLLLLRAGEQEKAGRIVETDLARRGEPELLWRARREVARASLLRQAQTALEQGNRERAIALLDQAIDLTDQERQRLELEARLRDLQNGRP